MARQVAMLGLLLRFVAVDCHANGMATAQRHYVMRKEAWHAYENDAHSVEGERTESPQPASSLDGANVFATIAPQSLEKQVHQEQIAQQKQEHGPWQELQRASHTESASLLASEVAVFGAMKVAAQAQIKAQIEAMTGFKLDPVHSNPVLHAMDVMTAESEGVASQILAAQNTQVSMAFAQGNKKSPQNGSNTSDELGREVSKRFHSSLRVCLQSRKVMQMNSKPTEELVQREGASCAHLVLHHIISKQTPCQNAIAVLGRRAPGLSLDRRSDSLMEVRRWDLFGQISSFISEAPKIVTSAFSTVVENVETVITSVKETVEETVGKTEPVGNKVLKDARTFATNLVSGGSNLLETAAKSLDASRDSCGSIVSAVDNLETLPHAIDHCYRESKKNLESLGEEIRAISKQPTADFKALQGSVADATAAGAEIATTALDHVKNASSDIVDIWNDTLTKLKERADDDDLDILSDKLDSVIVASDKVTDGILDWVDTTVDKTSEAITAGAEHMNGASKGLPPWLNRSSGDDAAAQGETTTTAQVDVTQESGQVLPSSHRVDVTQESGQTSTTAMPISQRFEKVSHASPAEKGAARISEPGNNNGAEPTATTVTTTTTSTATPTTTPTEPTATTVTTTTTSTATPTTTPTTTPQSNHGRSGACRGQSARFVRLAVCALISRALLQPSLRHFR